MKDGRDSQGHLRPNMTRFPDGINGTASKIHDLGLKIGIYSSAGTETCAGYPASIGYESIDAKTWADWGIDYLKYDNCNVPQNWTDTCQACVPDSSYQPLNPNGTCVNNEFQGHPLCPDGYDYSQSNTAERYRIMRDAIQVTGRPILYSLCEWGFAGVQQWGNSVGHSWRSTNDINSSWSRIVNILNQNSFYMRDVQFYGRPDPDMLEVGNGDLTYAETRSHFALWAGMKSPLLIGTALDSISDQNVALLKNRYLLAFNQDNNVADPAQPYKWGTNPNWTFNETFPAEFWSGPSSNGTLVLMFNPYNSTQSKAATWSEVPQLDGSKSYYVEDVWTGQDFGCISTRMTAQVDAHDTAALLVGPECEGGSEGVLIMA